MKYRLFNLATAASLVLCAATVALWVRSYRPASREPGNRRGWSVTASSGGVNICESSKVVQVPADRLWNQLRYDGRLGFRFAAGNYWTMTHSGGGASGGGVSDQSAPIPRSATSVTTSVPFRLYRIPLWFPCALLLAYPVARVSRRWRLLLRQRSGLCPACGYDLRASPDRCPECGTEVATAR